MIYLGYFILFFTVIQVLVATANLIFLQKFPKSEKSFNGLVSVLIPARNEEKNIANLLTDLQQQDYQNIEILVFNDQSSDQTVEIVNEFIQTDHRIKLFHSEGLPKYWLGKNYACYSLAKKANGDYFLFLDADVRVGGSIISDTVLLSKKHELGLLSIFPKQLMTNWGEYITVPNMNYILLSLLPLILVRVSKRPSLAAANGQFMLFNANTYKTTQPHKTMKTSKVEDIETAKYFKKENINVACLLGNNSITCKMYNTFPEAVNGFSKNVIMFFGDSFVLAVLFWLITTFGFVVVFYTFTVPVFISYLIFLLLIRLLISIASQQNIFKNLMVLILQQMALGLFIYKAIINTFHKQFEWKGRNIS